MPKYLVRVTESVNHDFVIEASSAEEAEEIYHSYDDVQLLELSDTQSDWDTHPYDVIEIED